MKSQNEFAKAAAIPKPDIPMTKPIIAGTRPILRTKKGIFDPPGQCRIGGHYFRTWCPSVRPSITKTKSRCNGSVNSRKTKTTDTMCENNDHLLTVAWWDGQQVWKQWSLPGVTAGWPCGSIIIINIYSYMSPKKPDTMDPKKGPTRNTIWLIVM